MYRCGCCNCYFVWFGFVIAYWFCLCIAVPVVLVDGSLGLVWVVVFCLVFMV